MSRRRLRARTRRVDGLPVVTARIWLLGGVRAESVPGQALITGRLLAEGSRRRTWDRIAGDAEDRGMVVQSYGTYEAMGVSVDALAEDWELALEWLAELSLEPVFPEDRFDWLRLQAAGELESMLDQPELRTARAFLDQIYAPHPYGRPLQGSPDDLRRLSREDCAGFHGRALGWGALVVVTGQIDEDSVRRRIDELFGDLEGEADGIPPPPSPAADAEPRRQITAGDADQVHLYLGHLTIPRSHPDTPALALAGVALGAGAGLAGRLPERIRESEGMAYHVDISPTAGAGLDPGRLVIYAGTSPRTAGQAEAAVYEELRRLLDRGIGEEELEEARSYLIGRDAFRRETARQWAELLADSELYGIGTDRAEWVLERLREQSREDVDTAVRRWIRPDELRVTVGLPAS